MQKPSIDGEVLLSTANEFAIQLIFELAERHSITLREVFDTFSKVNYWRVLNNTYACCELAHDGLKVTLEDIEEYFSQWAVKTSSTGIYKEVPFESQSITIIERIMEYDSMSREQAMQTWFMSKTYNEIIARGLTYISAMRAYFELKLEMEGNPEWMQKEFE